MSNKNKKEKIFGIRVRKSGGLELTRENYCKINNKSSFKKGDRFYSEKWCNSHYEKCMINFDLNIRYFESLSDIEFNNALDDFLEKNKGFKKVDDLNHLDGVFGYYIMVLDKYKQAYIGTTKNIKIRIMSHWSKEKQFDRLLFGSHFNSVLSIDSFRALDTTRIYAFPHDMIFELEQKFISSFPKIFLLNRIGGGSIPSGIDGFTYAVNTMNTRDLNIEIQECKYNYTNNDFSVNNLDKIMKKNSNSRFLEKIKNNVYELYISLIKR